MSSCDTKYRGLQHPTNLYFMLPYFYTLQCISFLFFSLVLSMSFAQMEKVFSVFTDVLCVFKVYLILRIWGIMLVRKRSSSFFAVHGEIEAGILENGIKQVHAFVENKFKKWAIHSKGLLGTSRWCWHGHARLIVFFLKSVSFIWQISDDYVPRNMVPVQNNYIFPQQFPCNARDVITLYVFWNREYHEKLILTLFFPKYLGGLEKPYGLDDYGHL